MLQTICSTETILFMISISMKSFTFGSRQGQAESGPCIKATCKECSSHSTCNGNHTCSIGKVAKSRTLSGKALVIAWLDTNMFK